MANVSPSTWFSGKSAPEDNKSVVDPFLVVAAVFLLYSPIGFVVTMIAFFAFNNYRVSVRVISGFAALYYVPFFLYIAIFSSAESMFTGYNKPFQDLYHAFRDGTAGQWFGDHVGYWLTMQMPFGIALGSIVASLWVSWKWVRRPAWEDDTRIPGPIQRWRLRAITRDIETDADGPSSGVTIGVTKYGNKIVQAEAEAAAHTLLAGGSGSGKTTTMMIGIRDLIRRGEPVFMVDMKDAQDLPAQLAEWCARYNRKFMHWSMTDWRIGYQGPADGPAFYNPIGRGDPSRKKDLLIGSEKWDVEYYKSVNEAYLQLGFQIAELVPDPDVDSFADVANILDWDKLRARAAQLYLNSAKTPDGNQHAAANGINSKWFERYADVLDPYTRSVLANAAQTIVKLEESERSAIKNMASRVQKLRTSTAGAWLRTDTENGRNIDLRKAAEEGWVILFSVDSATYKEVSRQVGGMIIQDLTTFSKELRSNPVRFPFHVYIDEFSSIGSDNIIDILARARDARMPTMLSTQALADLKKVDESFLDQVLGIVNCFIIHRPNKEDDAEVFAGLSGKQKTIRRMYGVEMTSGLPGGMGQGAGTGHGNIFEEEDYVARVADIQALERGQLVYISKSPKNRVVQPVLVVKEDANKAAIAMTERLGGGTGFIARLQRMPAGPALVRLLKGVRDEPAAPAPVIVSGEVIEVEETPVPEYVPLPEAGHRTRALSADEQAAYTPIPGAPTMPLPVAEDEAPVEVRIRPSVNPLFPDRPRNLHATPGTVPGMGGPGIPGAPAPRPAPAVPGVGLGKAPTAHPQQAPVPPRHPGMGPAVSPTDVPVDLGRGVDLSDFEETHPTKPIEAEAPAKVVKEQPVIDPAAFLGDAIFDGTTPAMPPVMPPTTPGVPVAPVAQQAPAPVAPATQVPLPPVVPVSLPGAAQASAAALPAVPAEDPNAWDYHGFDVPDEGASVFGGDAENDVEWESSQAAWEEFAAAPGMPVQPARPSRSSNPAQQPTTPNEPVKKSPVILDAEWED